MTEREAAEEQLDGEEFSFQSFFDGKHIVHTIPVQDHKRARDGDTGPNTGGMGSRARIICSHSLLRPMFNRRVKSIASSAKLCIGRSVKNTKAFCMVVLCSQRMACA